MIFAFMCETPRTFVECGKYNGYVATDEHLPESWQTWQRTHDVDADENNLLDAFVDVHGGITLDTTMSANWSIVPLTPVPVSADEFHRFRVIGFDTLHICDTPEMWGYEQVRKETLRFYAQIVELLKTYNDGNN